MKHLKLFESYNIKQLGEEELSKSRFTNIVDFDIKDRELLNELKNYNNEISCTINDQYDEGYDTAYITFKKSIHYNLIIINKLDDEYYLISRSHKSNTIYYLLDQRSELKYFIKKIIDFIESDGKGEFTI